VKASSASIGLRAHSGWAALVAVAGTRREIEVVDRRRVDLADPSVPGPKQPYHEAEGEPLARARRIVDACAAEAGRRSLASMREVVRQLRSRGLDTVGAALLLASNKPLPELESILASHALIHTADGELFRDALTDALRRCKIPILRLREREIFAQAETTLKRPAEEIRGRIAELGRGIGPPWTQDQKLAALAAWLTLAKSA
jgi:hypothetical protein